MTDTAESGPRDPAAAFWAFSLRVYETPGVMAACLDLQDRRGCDVNLLLLCGWLAITERQALAPLDMVALLKILGPWAETVVVPLRTIRRSLKREVPMLPSDRREAFRKRVSDLELDGERVAQGLLVSALAKQSPVRKDSARAALIDSYRAYWMVLELEEDNSDATSLKQLIMASLSESNFE